MLVKFPGESETLKKWSGDATTFLDYEGHDHQLPGPPVKVLKLQGKTHICNPAEKKQTGPVRGRSVPINPEKNPAF